VTAVALFGVEFPNPVLLAAGTAGFGREVDGVIELDALGGIVTKAVTPEPRGGHPAPRVAEFAGGMLNAVGLANPGLAAAREHELLLPVGEPACEGVAERCRRGTQRTARDTSRSDARSIAVRC